MKKYQVIALGALVLIGGSFWAFNVLADKEPEVSTQLPQDDQLNQAEATLTDLMSGVPSESNRLTPDVSALSGAEYQLSGKLEDVTNGPARSVNTNGDATGIAMAGLVESADDSKFVLNVEMEGLPQPNNGEFYEGWIVRKDPFKFISTGEVEFVDGVWINQFMSDDDLTDFRSYVLTIEPDDDDPAPDAHILEGEMSATN